MEHKLLLQKQLSALTQLMHSAYSLKCSGIVAFCAGPHQGICEAAYGDFPDKNYSEYNEMAYRMINSGKPVCVIDKELQKSAKGVKPQKFDAFSVLHNGSIFIVFVVADNAVLQLKTLAARACLFKALHEEQEALIRGAEKKAGSAERHLLEYSKISHDFKTPINIIQASVQLLKLKLIKEDESKYESLYSKIILMAQENIFKLSRLTVNMLDCVRAENGAMELLLSYESIAECIEKAIEQMRGFAAEKHIRIIFKPKLGMAEKYVFDTIKLDRIIINLLSNSITSIIESDNDRGKITVSIDADDSYLILSVSDNGKGIPKNSAGKVFESFYTDNKKGGSGLGLAVVKAMAELHKGSVNFVRLKQGVRFNVRLFKHLQASNEESLLSVSAEYGIHSADEYAATELAYLKNYFSDKN